MTRKTGIDRPGGSPHRRFPDIIHPFDYGYLEGTTAGDGEGIDVWRGSLLDPVVTAVIVSIDAHKRDAELKLLIGCTEDEMQAALATHHTNWQVARLIRRSDQRRQEDQ